MAGRESRSAGCEWLHVDFEEELGAFSLGSCGFSPTPAGVIALRYVASGPARGLCQKISTRVIKPRSSNWKKYASSRWSSRSG